MEQNKEEHHEPHVHHKKKKGLSKSFYMKVITLLAIVLVLFALYNIFQISSFNSLFEQKLIDAKEAARPAEIEAVIIKDSRCEDCFDIVPIIDSIKGANVNITKEVSLELDSDNAKKIIDKYNIEKVPTILLVGEIEKTGIRDMEEINNALVFTKLSPPYTDAKSNKILGRVSSVIIKDSSCDKCSDLDLSLNGIKQAGVVIVSEKVLEKGSKEGQELIKKYSIEKLPTLILSSDLEVYSSEITSAWDQIGSIESDGSYITREIVPPYVDLSTNKVVGLVSMTILVDKSCNECYDPNTFHKPILQRMGVVFDEEKSVDISSSKGKSLIEKYSIEKIPTVVLTGDVETYPALVRAWTDVGTAEDDGTYVFRKVEVAQQAYKDLSTDKVVSPQAAS